MKFLQLKGTAVVDLHEARKLGDLEDLMLDPQSRQLVELKVKVGFFGASIFIPDSWLKSVGPNAITVDFPSVNWDRNQSQAHPVQFTTSTAAVTPNANISTPGPDANEARDKNLVGLSQLLGNQVVSDKGNLFGEIKDVILNESDLAITGYEASMGGLFSRTHSFPATQEIHYGAKLVTVPEEFLKHAS